LLWGVAVVRTLRPLLLAIAVLGAGAGCASSVEPVAPATTAPVDTLAERDALEAAPDEVRSPLDDVSRLLDVPEAVLDALGPHLGAVRGWPVGVVVASDAELSTEHPGAAAGAVLEGRPVTVRTEARREVADLVVGRAAPADLAALTVGEETRLVGIERLVEPRETLR